MNLANRQFILSFFGACTGILMSYWGVTALIAHVPGFLLGTDARALDLSIDWRVLFFTLGLSMGATYLFGMFPARQSVRVNLARVLQEGERGGASRKQRLFMRGLVVSEVAIALMLLVGSVGLIKALIQRLDLNPGYDVQHIASVRLNLLGVPYEDVGRRIEFVGQLKERIAALPGVRTVAVSHSLPRGSIFNSQKAYATMDPPSEPGGGRDIAYCPVSPEYFSLAGLPLIKGRGITDRDRIGNTPVVVLNESTAKKLFEKLGDPIGKTISLPALSDAPLEVVGIVRAYANNPLAMVVFGPVTQRCFRTPYLLVQTRTNPELLLPALRSTLKAADPNQPLEGIATMREHLRKSLEGERGLLVMMGSIGVAAFALAVVGVGSVVNYAVAQRTREFGIRLSLGATRRNILMLIFREAAIPLSIGLALGFLGSLILQPLVWNIRTGVDIGEYPQYLMVAVLFAIVAIVASSPPARRAVRISPMEALRYD